MQSREEQAQEAAYLYAQRITQQELADIFHCSQSHVSRLLKLAEAQGWLRSEIRFDAKGIPHKRVDEIHRRMEPKTLALKLRKLPTESRVQVRQLRVYPSAGGDIDEQLERFGRLAAGRAIELLEKSSVVGVIFGETIHRVVDGIAWSGLKPRMVRPAVVTPVAGEVATYVRVGSSSSWLAHRLHELVNGDENHQLSLSSVPFLFPTHFDKPIRHAVRAWVESLASYQKIFGGDEPLISRIDCLFTSVGQDGKPLSAASKELTNAYGITISRLRELATTDLGATLVPAPGIVDNPDAKAELQAINECMVNLKLEDYTRISERAADPARSVEQQAPGVCLFAIGANKAHGLLAVLRKGLVNELVIDDALASELKRLIEPFIDDRS